MIAGMILGLVLAPVPSAGSPGTPAPAASSGPHDAAAAPQPEAPRALVVAVTGLSTTELRNALMLRLPERELLPPEAPRPAAIDFVEVKALADGTVVFTLITAEGRAYDRSMPAGSDPVREVAATLANLTFAIEAGVVEPDRVDVPQPAPAPAPPLATEPVPEPEPAPEPAPAPIRTPTPPSTQPEPPARPEPPPWELAPTVDLGMIVGLAPSTGADPLGAIHGRLGVDARRRRGGLVWAGARLGGWATHSLSLLRVRVDLGGGWAWAWGKRAELLLGGAATIEPWVLREDGERATLQLAARAAPRRPLIGGLVRLSPAIRLPLREHWALRLGPTLELSGSFVPQDGARTVDIARADGEDIESVLRLGGLELVVGVALALWIPVGG